MSAATSLSIPTAALREARQAPHARPTTLLELVGALGEVTDDEDEIVATVIYMLKAGHVRLCGNFRNAPLRDFE